MSGHEQLARDVDIDVAGLFGILRKKFWLLALITIVTFVALLVGLSFVSPRYEASTRIVIENRESIFTRNSGNDQGLSQSRFDKQAIGSQVEVINSDTVVLAVIEKLKIGELDEFENKPSLVDDLKGRLGVTTPTGATPVGSGANSINVSPASLRALQKFRSQLGIYAIADSRVIVIDFWSRDPELAKNVPNAIAEEYLALQKTSETEVTESATQWLGPEIDTLRQRVRAAEAKVAEYRANSDIIDGSNNALLSTQQLSEVSSELSRLRAERAAALAKVASIKTALQSGGSLDVIPEVISSPLIQRLRESQVALQAEISELSTTLLPNHPRLKALKSQLSNFDNQIRAAARNILKSLENNVSYTRTQEQELRVEVNRLKAEAARVQEAQVELRALEREAATERDLLQDYQRNFQQAASRNDRNYVPINARIISYANLPSEPFFPKIVPFATAGSLAALLLSIIALMTGALLSGRALKEVGGIPHTEEPVFEEVQAVPDAGSAAANTAASAAASVGEPIPAPAMETPLPAPAATSTQNTAPNAGVEYFPIDMAVQALASVGSGKVAVLSPGGDQGSVIVPILARKLAAKGKGVAVIDLSSTAVSTVEMLGQTGLKGVREVLGGSAQFRDAIYQDRSSTVHIMPTGVSEPTDSAVAMKRLSVIIDAINQQYAYVIIDCGYSTADGVARIADPGSSIIVSALGAAPEDVARVYQEMSARGLDEVVPVMADTTNNRPVAA